MTEKNITKGDASEGEKITQEKKIGMGNIDVLRMWKSYQCLIIIKANVIRFVAFDVQSLSLAREKFL